MKYKITRYNGYIAVVDSFDIEVATVDDYGNVTFCRNFNDDVKNGILSFLKSKKLVWIQNRRGGFYMTALFY